MSKQSKRNRTRKNDPCHITGMAYNRANRKRRRLCVLSHKNNHSYTARLRKKWTNHWFMHEKVGGQTTLIDPTLEKVGGQLTPWPRASAVYVYLHSFSRGCLPKSRNPAKFRQNLTLQQFKVIDLDVNRKPMYDFLLVTNSNFGRICYRFRDIDA